jgi:hypothetical protein
LFRGVLCTACDGALYCAKDCTQACPFGTAPADAGLVDAGEVTDAARVLPDGAVCAPEQIVCTPCGIAGCFTGTICAAIGAPCR